MCKNQKENLIEQKKKLDDMNGVLRRFKNKEENFFGVKQQTLQISIEKIGLEILDIEKLIETSEASVADNKETNVEELDKRINEEKTKILSHMEKISNESLMTSITPHKESLEEL